LWDLYAFAKIYENMGWSELIVLNAINDENHIVSKFLQAEKGRLHEIVKLGRHFVLRFVDKILRKSHEKK
jgi:hypothetical protein